MPKSYFIKSLLKVEEPLKSLKDVANEIIKESDSVLSLETYSNSDSKKMVHAREAKVFARKLLSIDMDHYIDAQWDPRRPELTEGEL